MNNTRKRYLGLVLVLAILLFMTAIYPSLRNIRIRVSGAVMPESSRTHTYGGTPVRLLSVSGKRWESLSEVKFATAYYALVLLPTASACDNGSQSVSDGVLHTDTWKWMARKNKDGPEQELRFEAAYDALGRTLTIGSRSYPLADGNLFVIHFDGAAKPIVRQLDATINENVDSLSIFDRFKSLLRGDEAAQNLIGVRDDSATSDCDRRR